MDRLEQQGLLEGQDHVAQVVNVVFLEMKEKKGEQVA